MFNNESNNRIKTLIGRTRIARALMARPSSVVNSLGGKYIIKNV